MSENIHALQRELEAKNEAIAMLDHKLRPYWQKLNQLQIGVILTHEHVSDESGRGPPVRVTQFRREGAPDRKGLFVELDRLNQTFAPDKDERRILLSEAKALTRQIQALEKEEQRKRKKPRPPQGELEL